MERDGVGRRSKKLVELLNSIPIQGTKQIDEINHRAPFPAVHLSCCLSDFQPPWN